VGFHLLYLFIRRHKKKKLRKEKQARRMPFPAEIRRFRQITTLKYSLTSYPLFFNMNRKKKTVKNKITTQKIPMIKERPGILCWIT